MKYLIKAIKIDRKKARSINQASTWKRAEQLAKDALETNKYIKIIIERSYVVKVFKHQSKEV